jgi:hypothetical protein
MLTDASRGGEASIIRRSLWALGTACVDVMLITFSCSFFLAQCTFYGLTSNANAPVRVMRQSLEEAIRSKTLRPQEQLADLEFNLNSQFRKLKAEGPLTGKDPD